MTDENELVCRAAVEYAQHGWHVYQVYGILHGACECRQKGKCPSAGKHPTANKGVRVHSADPETVAGWFEFHQSANVGIACGPSGLLVLDADGEEGLRIAESWCLPVGPTVVTGSGGKHFYFRAPTVAVTNTVRVAPGIDVRGAGTGVIAPPSRHKNGTRYQWRNDWRMPVPEIPPHVLTALTSAPPRGVTKAVVRFVPDGDGFGPGPAPVPFDPVRGAVGVPSFENAPLVRPKAQDPDGPGRRATLLTFAGRMLGAGIDPDEIFAQATWWNDRLEVPLDDTEVRKHLDSLARQHERRSGEKAVRGEEVPTADPSFPPNPFPRTNTDMSDTSFPPKPFPPTDTAMSDTSSPPNPFPPTDSNMSETYSPPNPFPPMSWVEGQVVNRPPEPPADAGLHPDAFHGIIGDYVRTVTPLTEADPAGVLVSLLTGFGSVIGRQVRHHIGRRHAGNLFAVLVGSTSRKGTAWTVAAEVLRYADPEWYRTRVARGLGSGE